MSEMVREKALHIAMYPWLAMGHITSYLHLANKLAERGHKISFIVPAKTRPKLASHNHHPNLIKFIPITVPQVDGLPAGAETTNDVPAWDGAKIMEAMDLTQSAIDSHLAQLRPEYVFFDVSHWLPGLARKHEVKSIVYLTTYMVNLAYITRTKPDDAEQIEAEDLMNPPPGFPFPDMKLQAHEARSYHYVYHDFVGDSGMSFWERTQICFSECDAVAIKSCTETEGPYWAYFEKYMNKPYLMAGLVMSEPPSTMLDDRLDGWLNEFSNGSVVFCALGSECVLEVKQFQELVLGLELSGRPFLAALMPPDGYETIESALPEGYEARTKGRGLVHGGWVQQRLILNHPSVGCFITHCGAGSLSEAMLSECQIVLLPQAIDQFINARLMSVDLRVGVEVDKAEDDGFFTKEAVYEAVHTVMEPGSNVGREVRANHSKLREMLKNGLDSYIDGLVQSLNDLH